MAVPVTESSIMTNYQNESTLANLQNESALANMQNESALTNLQNESALAYLQNESILANCPCTIPMDFNFDAERTIDWFFAAIWTVAGITMLVLCGVIIHSAWSVWKKQPAYSLLLINFCVGQLLMVISWSILITENMTRTEPVDHCNDTSQVANPSSSNTDHVLGMVGRLASFASMMTKTAIALELYCYLCRALQYSKTMALRRSQMLIVGAWSVGLIYSVGYFILPDNSSEGQLQGLLYLMKASLSWWCATGTIVVISGTILITAYICIMKSTCSIIYRDHQNHQNLQHMAPQGDRSDVCMSTQEPTSIEHSESRLAPEPVVGLVRSPSQCSVRSQVTVQIVPGPSRHSQSNTIGVVLSHEFPNSGTFSARCSFANHKLYLNPDQCQNEKSDGDDVCGNRTNSDQSGHQDQPAIPRIEVVSPSTFAGSTSCSDHASTYRPSTTTVGDDFGISMNSSMMGRSTANPSARSSQYSRQESVTSSTGRSGRADTAQVAGHTVTGVPVVEEETGETSPSTRQAIVNNWLNAEKRNSTVSLRSQVQAEDTVPNMPSFSSATIAVPRSSPSVSQLSIIDFLCQDSDDQSNRNQCQAQARYPKDDIGQQTSNEDPDTEPQALRSLWLRLTAVIFRYILPLLLFSCQWLSPFAMAFIQVTYCSLPHWAHKLWWTGLLVIAPLQVFYYTAINRNTFHSLRNFRLPCKITRVQPVEQANTPHLEQY